KDGIRKLDAIALEVIVDGIFDYKNIDDVRKYIQL
ncbi:MAG: transposase, partial [Tissierellia bacterium]|nr:transposase [Tissierellia bacterium]